jgi:hypothetical protein
MNNKKLVYNLSFIRALFNVFKYEFESVKTKFGEKQSMTHNLYKKYIGVLLLIALFPVEATELTHHFQSPTNGGNPLNGTFLFNQATDQNNFKDPALVEAAAAAAARQAAATTTSASQSNLENFKNSLQRTILSGLAATSAKNVFNADGTVKLGADLSFDLNNDGVNDFSVVVDNATTNGNVSIVISDGITSTTLTVPYVQ